MNDRFDSPEQAAMSGFSPKHCRVIASRVLGDDAFVLLDTNIATRYLYGVNCWRDEDGWHESSSSNCGGWSYGWHQTGQDPELGTLSMVWEEMPEGADAVRVRLEDDVQEAPIHDGVFLVVWWRVRDLDPIIESCRIRGEWIPYE